MTNLKQMIIGVLGLLLALTAAHAAPLDDQVPADAIFYAGWAGAAALQPQYAQSNLKGVIEASTIQKFVADMLPKLLQQAGANDPGAAQALAKAQAALRIAWLHPVAIYFCPIDISDPQKPGFRAGILCDAGPDAQKLVDLWTDALAHANADTGPLPNGISLDVSQTNGRVRLTLTGKAAPAAAGTLAASPTYINTMAQVIGSSPPALAIYLDAPKVLASLADIANTHGGASPQAATKAQQVMDALGLTRLGPCAAAAGFDGKGWMLSSFITTTGPRTGLLCLLDAPPLSDTALAPVPADAVMFSATHLDLMKIYAEARATAGKIDTQSLPVIDGALAQANTALGLDLLADVVAPLGNEWIVYRAPNPDLGFLSALVLKLNDGPRLARAIATLEKLFNEKSGSPIKIEKARAGKSDVSMVAVLTLNIAWTVQNGYLYVSTLDGIPAAIAQVETKAPSVVTNPQYQKVIQDLLKRAASGAKPTAIAYSNPVKSYRELRTAVLGIIPMLRGQGIDIPMDLLPDSSAISEFMTPGASISWSDAAGAHFASSSAFPGASLIGGQALGPGGAATGVAILLPSLGKARELSNRSVDAANLRGLAFSSILWAHDHNEDLPDHVGRLVLDGAISAKMLVSKRGDATPLLVTPELEALGHNDFTKFAATLDQHTDYVYMGKATHADLDAGIILAYEKISPGLQDGINVVYADGHVEFIRWPHLPEIVNASNKLAAAKNWPTIDLDALVKSLPKN